MGEFEKLLWAARVANDSFPCLSLIHEWSDKRQHVAMYQKDMPNLVDAYKMRKQTPLDEETDVVAVDPMPGLRLAAACEGLANTVYAACEIAAAFANQASGHQLPSKFNQFRKKVKAGKLDASLIGGVQNFEWYERIREMRTEWTHHSTIFVGPGDDGPVILVKPLRHDKVVLPRKTLLSVQDLLDWSGRAVRVVDRFGLEVYHRAILPKLDLDREIVSVEFGAGGFPLIRRNKFVPKMTTIREHLRKAGFAV